MAPDPTGLTALCSPTRSVNLPTNLPIKSLYGSVHLCLLSWPGTMPGDGNSVFSKNPLRDSGRDAAPFHILLLDQLDGTRSTGPQKRALWDDGAGGIDRYAGSEHLSRR